MYVIQKNLSGRRIKLLYSRHFVDTKMQVKRIFYVTLLRQFKFHLKKD